MTTTNFTHTFLVPEEPTVSTRNFVNRGMLTSRYKEEIKDNFSNMESSSLFRLKQHVRANQHRFMPAAGTILKVSVFVIAYLIAFI
ncbi:hypothetical protein KORDIASMS9_02137 [Kordia sp. SMS9]|uniref:hypothetical protein n=1 Tax=Kordia sp. SMS9 TaxID=2282170 RepID=UPI000E0D21A8|nr:hypothetical protein [Kordia sp. SMS9]AXG69909.1 hypothetical protein KORDIASMS9_02137 [Kordia sp. SMS9]